MHMQLPRPDRHGEPGFTLIELMIAMVISSIIAAAIFSAYKMQRDVFEAQDQITEVQQNLRAATWQMIREIRMAGFDPTESGNVQIIEAQKDLLYFTIDLNEDGNVDEDNDDTGEHIAYDLYTQSGKSILGRTSADKDIIVADQGGGHWEVAPPTSTYPIHNPVAEYIEELEFYYTLENGTAKTQPTATEIPYIRSIQVSLLARTRYPDREYTDGLTYTSASGTAWGPYNDHFRRRLLTTTVTCRNLGL